MDFTVAFVCDITDFGPANLRDIGDNHVFNRVRKPQMKALADFAVEFAESKYDAQFVTLHRKEKRLVKQRYQDNDADDRPDQNGFSGGRKVTVFHGFPFQAGAPGRAGNREPF
jgi:hypothetical protein